MEDSRVPSPEPQDDVHVNLPPKPVFKGRTTSGQSNLLKAQLSEFCPQCGTILPLPNKLVSAHQKINCGMCDYELRASAYNGLTYKKRIHFNSVETSKQSKKERKEKKKGIVSKDGPVVERQCGHCGHEEMYYKTAQTRSADEGQTIFYYCCKCGGQENENS